MEFAQLLLSHNFIHTHHYHLWAGLFPFVYGAEVAEVAARGVASINILDEVID